MSGVGAVLESVMLEVLVKDASDTVELGSVLGVIMVEETSLVMLISAEGLTSGVEDAWTVEETSLAGFSSVVELDWVLETLEAIDEASNSILVSVVEVGSEVEEVDTIENASVVGAGPEAEKLDEDNVDKTASSVAIIVEVEMLLELSLCDVDADEELWEVVETMLIADEEV